eukprot:scaffold5677_cov99-Skeletonema_dohrnii-CCMP3373.AAC.1
MTDKIQYSATTINESKESSFSGELVNNPLLFHCISAIPQFEDKSFEELRLEDYSAGNKGKKQPIEQESDNQSYSSASSEGSCSIDSESSKELTIMESPAKKQNTAGGISFDFGQAVVVENNNDQKEEGSDSDNSDAKPRFEFGVSTTSSPTFAFSSPAAPSVASVAFDFNTNTAKKEATTMASKHKMTE